MSARSDLDLMCSEVVELVTDYLLDALPAEDRETIERHLHLCPGCDAYVGQMRQTVSWAEILRPRAGGAGAPPERLMAIYRRWKAKKGTP